MEPPAGSPASAHLTLTVWLVAVIVPVLVSGLAALLLWLGNRRMAHSALEAAKQQAAAILEAAKQQADAALRGAREQSIEAAILGVRCSLAERHAAIFHERANDFVAVVSEAALNEDRAKQFVDGFPHVELVLRQLATRSVPPRYRVQVREIGEAVRELNTSLHAAFGNPPVPAGSQTSEQLSKISTYTVYLVSAVNALCQAVDICNEARLYEKEVPDYASAIAEAVKAAKEAPGSAERAMADMAQSLAAARTEDESH